MYAGFGHTPRYYHPSADDTPLDDMADELTRMAHAIRQTTQTAPLHRDFIMKNCAATGVG